MKPGGSRDYVDYVSTCGLAHQCISAGWLFLNPHILTQQEQDSHL